MALNKIKPIDLEDVETVHTKDLKDYKDLVTMVLNKEGMLAAAINPAVFDNPVLLEFLAEALQGTAKMLLDSIKEVHPTYETGKDWGEALEQPATKDAERTGSIKICKRPDTGEKA